MVTGDLPDPFEQLVTAGRRSGAHIRPVLLRVLVDMFVSRQAHTDEDARQFEEIMAHLLDDADDESRLAAAEQLARHPSTPRGLLDRFVAERSQIAAKVIAQADMEPRALSAAAVFGTTAMAIAVARRRDIEPTVMRSLAERPEIEVLCALVENRHAPIDRPLFRYLARRAEGHPDLAARLLERGQAGELVSPFLAAEPTERGRLIAAARRQDLGMTGSGLPPQLAAATAAAIERAAFHPGLDGLETALACALECSTEAVTSLIDDPQGEPFALLLAACGISRETAARLFILGPPAIAHSYSKVKKLLDIVQTVSPRAAWRLVAGMVGRPAESARRVAPHADQPEPLRRGEAAAVRREAPARQSGSKRAGGSA